MAREIKINSAVKVIEDRDSGMLVGKQGIVTSLANDKVWVQFPNRPIPLPFSRDELKVVNRKRKNVVS